MREPDGGLGRGGWGQGRDEPPCWERGQGPAGELQWPRGTGLGEGGLFPARLAADGLAADRQTDRGLGWGGGAVTRAPQGLAGGAGWTDGGRSQGSSCPAAGGPCRALWSCVPGRGAGVRASVPSILRSAGWGRGCVPGPAQCVCGRVSAWARWGGAGQKPEVRDPCLSLGIDRAPGMGPCVPVVLSGRKGAGARLGGFQRTDRAASSPPALPPRAPTRSAARPAGRGQGAAPTGLVPPSMLSAIKITPADVCQSPAMCQPVCQRWSHFPGSPMSWGLSYIYPYLTKEKDALTGGGGSSRCPHHIRTDDPALQGDPQNTEQGADQAGERTGVTSRG